MIPTPKPAQTPEEVAELSDAEVASLAYPAVEGHGSPVLDQSIQRCIRAALTLQRERIAAELRAEATSNAMRAPRFRGDATQDILEGAAFALRAFADRLSPAPEGRE